MSLGEGSGVGFKAGCSPVETQENGKVGDGVGTGKSMRKLCRNYPWAIYPLVSSLLQIKSEVSKRGWREGVGGTQAPKKSPKKSLEMCPPSHKEALEKGTEKGPESLAYEGFPRANPSVRQPLFETSDLNPLYRFGTDGPWYSVSLGKRLIRLNF